MTGIKDKFTQIGGQFLVSDNDIGKYLSDINAFIFDWDGVFNNGYKDSERGSIFSEADSMGCNMLRFNQWRISKSIPLFFIITGENNDTAVEFAKREHFTGVYTRIKNKRKALENIVVSYDVSFKEIAFVFDDIIDISAAGLCKLALCVRRKSSPLFTNYLVEQSICQYITGNEGGNHAVREICELLMGLTGEYNKTISKRIEFDAEYQQYLSERNSTETRIETSI